MSLPNVATDSEVVNISKKEKCPSRGKRYSKTQKEEIHEYAKAHSVDSAAVKFNITGENRGTLFNCLIKKRRGAPSSRTVYVIPIHLL